MCGIAGLIDPSGALNLAALLAQMCDVQDHRGPDDAGVWVCDAPAGDNVGLGSRRLAILDLSPAGHMPMTTPDGMIAITYNGEVYNSPALRAKLEEKGYRFRSHSDTEVILYLYQEYGPDCLPMLNGMFALAIWDQQRCQLMLARDHFGIKPLYYCASNGGLAFASEVKALLRLPSMPRCVNRTALHQYLTFLWVPDPLTMFEGIYKLEPGHKLVFRDGEIERTPFWHYRFPPAGYQYPEQDEALTAELRTRFSSAVRSQLLSDVPVGAFLSAGLDSSSIVAAMAAATDQPVHTYTIAFADHHRRGETTLDDVTVARRTAEHFGCRHTNIVANPDVADLLPKLTWHMDEPTADPALIMAFLVNREARKDATVLLSGVGGDEIFGGYRKYRAHFLAERYRRIPPLLRERVISRAVASLPSFRGSRLKGYVRLAKKMARSGGLPYRERFLMDSVYLTETQKDELYAPSFWHGEQRTDPLLRHMEHFQDVADADVLNQLLYVDSKTFMPNLNLNYNDKMSMASSVEVRVPFLDRELADWVAWNVPPSAKLHGSTTKHILREAMRPVLPPEVLRQAKAGFGAPIDYWLANELRPMVDDALSDAAVQRRGLFDPVAVRRLVAEQRRGRQDWSFQVWQLLTLELWFRVFID